MKELLERLIRGETLHQDEAQAVLKMVVTQDIPSTQMGAFLALLRTRSLSYEELSGFREALLELRVPVDLKVANTLDVCGTGGDGKGTFNISTLAAFIVAGAGYMVTKHGNSSQSSACGSSDVLALLGNRFLSTSEELQRCLEEAGVCYLHAPLFQPALKRVSDARKQLGIRTLFNVLGPLLNPAQPQCQLLGVSSKQDMELYSNYFLKSGNSSTIVMSRDGYDEISLTDSFWFCSRGTQTLLDPRELGFSLHVPAELEVRLSSGSHAEVFRRVLLGEATAAQQDVVIINSAFAIHTLEPQISIQECILRARESLLSGAALHSYNTFHSICKLNEKN